MDLACSIQQVTEEIVLKMAKHVQKETKMRYLCLAGGVALNCVLSTHHAVNDKFSGYDFEFVIVKPTL